MGVVEVGIIQGLDHIVLDSIHSPSIYLSKSILYEVYQCKGTEPKVVALGMPA